VTNKHLIIAIDGTAASGKGTLAKKLGAALGIPYLCTGNLFRMVAKKLLAVPVLEQENVAELAAKFAKNLTLADVSDCDLAAEEIASLASIVAKIPEVRSALALLQRNLAEEVKQLIVEGRDIGTVIFPNATFKFFITADVEERARRRDLEYCAKNIPCSYEQILQDLQLRDASDSTRSLAPLVVAPDAIYIDTTHLSADLLLEQVLGYMRKRELDIAYKQSNAEKNTMFDECSGDGLNDEK
jgi:cytidylate kinase